MICDCILDQEIRSLSARSGGTTDGGESRHRSWWQRKRSNWVGFPSADLSTPDAFSTGLNSTTGLFRQGEGAINSMCSGILTSYMQKATLQPSEIGAANSALRPQFVLLKTLQAILSLCISRHECHNHVKDKRNHGSCCHDWERGGSEAI